MKFERHPWPALGGHTAENHVEEGSSERLLVVHLLLVLDSYSMRPAQQHICRHPGVAVADMVYSSISFS